MALGTAAAIAIGVGAATGGVGAIVSANAASNAAEAQGNIAQEQLAQAKQAQQFAIPTSAELENLGNQIQLYDAANSQSKAQLSTLQEQITKTYGANVLELGQQLHDQITGTDSGVVKTAQDAVTRQRSQLQQSLIEKMGPGALTSTAGAQALNNFDIQSTAYLANLRQNSVGQIIQNIGGLQGGQSSAVGDVLNIQKNLSGLLGQIQQTQNVFQTRQANAAMGVTPYAGADQVQALQQAKGTQALGSQIASIGGTIAGAGIGSAIKSAGAPGVANNEQSSAIAQNGFNGNLLDTGTVKPATSTNINANDLSRSAGSSDLKFGQMDNVS